MTKKPANLKAWNAKRLRQAIEAAGVALWSWDVDTDHITMDEAAFHLWAVPEKSPVTFEDLSAHIHPADRDRVRSAFAATRAISGPYEIDFRIMAGQDVRWISARDHLPLGDDCAGDGEGSDAKAFRAWASARPGAAGAGKG